MCTRLKNIEYSKIVRSHRVTNFTYIKRNNIAVRKILLHVLRARRKFHYSYVYASLYFDFTVIAVHLPR